MSDIKNLNTLVENIFSSPKFKKILNLFYASTRLKGYSGIIEFNFVKYQGDGHSFYNGLYIGGEYSHEERTDKKLFDFVYSQVQKIMEFVDEMDIDEELLGSIDYDSVHTENFDLAFDFKEKEFKIVHSISYYDVAWETITRDFDGLSESTKNDLNEFCQLNKYFKVSFAGSGDSGYIEELGYNEDDESFDVPASLTDDLYDMLSSFGGWEINEGSQGDFEISCGQKEIILNFGGNYEESGTRTIFKTKFDTDYELSRPQ